MHKFNRAYFAYEPTAIFQRDGNWSFGREPVLRRMPDGSLISLVYSGGKREPAPENLALIVRSEDDGATWSKPEILFKHQGRCCWATEIFTGGPQPFLIVHTYDYAGFFSELRASMSYTGDSGRTWSDPATLKGIPPNVAVRQGKVLSNGVWLFPVYWLEQYGDWNWREIDVKGDYPKTWHFASGVLRSSDQGRTFSLSGYLHLSNRSFWEPEAIELSPGHLLMYLRCDGSGTLWQSESRDYGVTWSSAAATAIPNSGSKVVAFMIEGRLTLLHNPVAQGRSVLELWCSDDGGVTWPTKLRLAESLPNGPGENEPPPWVCYPHGFADADKRLLYLACDSVDMHYLMKVPFNDFLPERSEP